MDLLLMPLTIQYISRPCLCTESRTCQHPDILMSHDGRWEGGQSGWTQRCIAEQLSRSQNGMLGRVQPSQQCIAEAFTFKLALRKWRQAWNGGQMPNALRRVRTPKGRVNAAVTAMHHWTDWSLQKKVSIKECGSKRGTPNALGRVWREEWMQPLQQCITEAFRKKKEFKLASSEVKEVKELTHNLAKDWWHK